LTALTGFKKKKANLVTPN